MPNEKTAKNISSAKERSTALVRKHIIGKDDRVKLTHKDGQPTFITPKNEAPSIKYDKFTNMMPTVGRLRSRDGETCTATHLGKGWFISAGHCFRMTPQEKYSKRIEDCRDYSVTLTLGKEPATYICKYVPAIEDTTHLQRDYAIFNVFDTGAPSIDSVPAARISRSPAAAKTKRFIMASAYGQPTELMWLSGLCSCKHPPNDEVVSHDCDSDKGASGSLIFDIDDYKIDPSDGSVRYAAVALHLTDCALGVGGSAEGYGHCAMDLSRPPLKHLLAQYVGADMHP